MDPIGLALENFDAVGRWRPKGDDGAELDTTGSLPDGTSFNGPVQLRQALLGRPELFASAVAEKLMTYALGRGLEYYDGAGIRSIVREAAGNQYRFSSIVWGIVNSTSFQMKRTAPAREGAKSTATSGQ